LQVVSEQAPEEIIIAITNEENSLEDLYGDGVMFKVRVSDVSELEDLMDSEEYEEMVAKEKE